MPQAEVEGARFKFNKGLGFRGWGIGLLEVAWLKRSSITFRDTWYLLCSILMKIWGTGTHCGSLLQTLNSAPITSNLYTLTPKSPNPKPPKPQTRHLKSLHPHLLSDKKQPRAATARNVVGKGHEGLYMSSLACRQRSEPF